ncbi:hypothetical protein Scep_030638 [Stephania cephalantha]|uniref:MADS-box domain-containing protein n=1 Tax=Stephania cephalantha TaxID=152367 RepID=A0AAP0E4H3_9MAGN
MADEVKVVIDPKDIELTTARSGGAGGKWISYSPYCPAAMIYSAYKREVLELNCSCCDLRLTRRDDGKKKIEIKAIEDKEKRLVTFSKRRKGLFNKAKQMCMIDETMKMSIVVFSPVGKPFSFHHPSATNHTAIDQFLNGQNPSRQSTDTKEGFWREKVNLDQIQTFEELVKFENELKSLKNTAMARLQEIESNNRSYEASTTSSSSCFLNCCGATDEGLMVEDEEINAFSGFTTPTEFVYLLLIGNMDMREVEESVFAASDAKLHRGMCSLLSAIVCKILAIFPELEASRPRSKSGIQALCSLHVALEKAKSLLQHCSDCSKLYLGKESFGRKRERTTAKEEGEKSINNNSGGGSFDFEASANPSKSQTNTTRAEDRNVQWEEKRLRSRPSRASAKLRFPRLFTKAEQMCMIDETMKISIVVFSSAGKPFSFHHPSTDHTAIDHFLNRHNPSDSSHTARQPMDTKEGFWWDKVNIDELQTVGDLTKFEDELESLKNTATTRLQEIELQRTSEAASTSSSLRLIDCGSNEGPMVEDEEINALLGGYATCLEDGYVNCIEEAKQPNYLVTADDVDSYLAIEDDEDVYRCFLAGGKTIFLSIIHQQRIIPPSINFLTARIRVADTKEGFWWEKVNLDQIQTLEELVKFEDELKSLKNTAMARLQEIESNNSSYEASMSCLLNCGGATDERLMVEDEEINALLGFYDPVTPPHL